MNKKEILLKTAKQFFNNKNWSQFTCDMVEDNSNSEFACKYYRTMASDSNYTREFDAFLIGSKVGNCDEYHKELKNARILALLLAAEIVGDLL